MRPGTIRALNALNGRFYAGQAASFSATRRAPWPGWRRCLPHVEAALTGGALGEGGARVLDLGCGNLRFEAFLAGALPDVALSFAAVDACEPLVAFAGDLPANARVRTGTLDVVEALLAAGDPSSIAAFPDEGAFDVAVAFGLLHHIPSARLRASLLGAIVESTRPGGAVAVSLWRFLDDPDFARKADEEHARALEELAVQSNVAHLRLPARCKVATAGDPAEAFPHVACEPIDPADFEAGDRLLGWQGRPGAYRYCHSFSNADVDALVAAVADRARLVDRFRADGRTGDLNEYLVFEVLH